jgi:hypothetical protein
MKIKEGVYLSPDGLHLAVYELKKDFFKLYDVWACEVVETITINVKEWRQQNERNY